MVIHAPVNFGAEGVCPRYQWRKGNSSKLLWVSRGNLEIRKIWRFAELYLESVGDGCVQQIAEHHAGMQTDDVGRRALLTGVLVQHILHLRSHLQQNQENQRFQTDLRFFKFTQRVGTSSFRRKQNEMTVTVK